MSRIDCPSCEGTCLVDNQICEACEGTGVKEVSPPPYDAVWIANAWKAVVHGRMQKPDFNSRGAALAFAMPAALGSRKEEPIQGE